MKAFSKLYKSIDSTNSSLKKIAVLVEYFSQVEDKEKLWTIALFTHRRPSRPVKTSLLREWASELTQLPLWLFEESYHIVGDLAETISLVLKNPKTEENKTLADYLEELILLKAKTEEEKNEYVLKSWNSLDQDQRFLFNKLITGGFRIGVSQRIIVKALAKFTNQEENVIAHRLMGNWDPGNTSFHRLIVESSQDDDISKPYPFYLAYPLEEGPEDLGNIEDWSAEWKWDGIRGQLIKRKGQLFVWSRGEELVTHKYPEYQAFLNIDTDDFVIDGEILAFKEGKPLPFNSLQTRIGRKNVGKKLLESTPVILQCYDLLEYQGEDMRDRPLIERQALLQTIIECEELEGVAGLSKPLQVSCWQDLVRLRETSREIGAEGLMLKRKAAAYKVGRKKGDWWKWKIDPMTVDAVMIYAQRGHGRRANMYTDFTFGAKNEDILVPFAKAYSGLTDKEFAEITKWVKKNTLERYGPVSAVKPEQVFEIAFEGIAMSKRHKSGIALRFPRIKRWRKDKKAIEADSLDTIKKFLK